MVNPAKSLRRLLLLWLAVAAPAQAAVPVLTFGIIADAGSWTDNSRQVRDSMKAAGVTNVILPGDNLYDDHADYDSVWSNWTKLGFQYPVVALGNHTQGYAKEMAYFGKPGEYYSTTIGSAQFLVLNSDNTSNVPTQMKWLQTQLAASSAQFVFVVFHHPPVTLSTRHSWNEKQAFQDALLPILQRYKGKLTGLMVGHDHIASLAEMGEIPLIVSGASFESRPAASVRGQQRGLSVQTRWIYEIGSYYWTRLDLNPDSGEAWINFVREDSKVSCSVRIQPRPLLLRDNCGKTGQAIPR